MLLVVTAVIYSVWFPNRGESYAMLLTVSWFLRTSTLWGCRSKATSCHLLMVLYSTFHRFVRSTFPSKGINLISQAVGTVIPPIYVAEVECQFSYCNTMYTVHPIVFSSVRFIGLIYKYCVIVYRWGYKSNHDLENCPFVIRWTPTSGSPIAHWIVYLVLLALMWQNTTLMRVSQQLTASPRMFESDMWYSIIIILFNTPIGVRTVHAKC